MMMTLLKAKWEHGVVLTCHGGAQGQACLGVVGVDGDLSHGRHRDGWEGDGRSGQRGLGAGSH